MKHADFVDVTAANKPNAATAFQMPASGVAPNRTPGEAGYANNDTMPYSAFSSAGFETGIGTYTTGTPNTVVRTTILSSSNSGSAVDFSGGGDVNFSVQPIAKLVELLMRPGVVIVRNDGSATQSIAASTFTKITTALATETKDQQGWWDHANSKFLPNKSGSYLIIAGMQIALADQSSAIVLVRLNGSDYAHLARGWMSAASGTPNAGVSGSTIVLLNGTTDYVEMFAYQNDTVARSTIAGAERLFFMAVRVGDYE
jgi:hypothetical protein